MPFTGLKCRIATCHFPSRSPTLHESWESHPGMIKFNLIGAIVLLHFASVCQQCSAVDQRHSLHGTLTAPYHTQPVVPAKCGSSHSDLLRMHDNQAVLQSPIEYKQGTRRVTHSRGLAAPPFTSPHDANHTAPLRVAIVWEAIERGGIECNRLVGRTCYELAARQC